MGPIIILVMFIAMPMLLIFYNKRRTAGKMLCTFVRRDKSTVSRLCELRDDFVIYEDRAYDVHPDFVRITRFPSGLPYFFQEVVAHSLYDEEDARPLDWLSMLPRDAKESSMDIRTALEENLLRKLVREASAEGGLPSGGFMGNVNWKKVIPIILIIAGVVGFILITRMGGGFFGGGG